MSYRAPPTALVFATFGLAVHALDAASGAVVWSNNQCHKAAGGAIIHRRDRVFIAGRGEAHALDAHTGRVLWSRELKVMGRCGLILDDDRLYIGGHGVVACVHVDGALLWQNEFKGLGLGNLAFAVGDQFARDDRDA